MCVVASVGFEVGIEASLTALHVVLLPWKLGAFLSSCRIFPFSLCGQAVALHITCLGPQALEQIVGTPGAERVGLLPCHAHHRIVVVGGV